MKPKAALLVAAGVTAFVLVITGAIIRTLMQPTPAQQSLELDQPLPDSPTITAVLMDPQPTAVEVQVIEQPAVAAQPAQTNGISAQEAAAIAQTFLGGGTIERVEREEKQNRLMYEVRFSHGPRVFVDAISGEIVYVHDDGYQPKAETDGHGDGSDHDDEPDDN